MRKSANNKMQEMQVNNNVNLNLNFGVNRDNEKNPNLELVIDYSEGNLNTNRKNENDNNDNINSNSNRFSDRNSKRNSFREDEANKSSIPISLTKNNFENKEKENNNNSLTNNNNSITNNKIDGLKGCNWIKNIRIQREMKKKQIREMKDLKIDKTYVPEIMNKFYYDPLEEIYKSNVKNPLDFVEFSRKKAEDKIYQNIPNDFYNENSEELSEESSNGNESEEFEEDEEEENEEENKIKSKEKENNLIDINVNLVQTPITRKFSSFQNISHTERHNFSKNPLFNSSGKETKKPKPKKKITTTTMQITENEKFLADLFNDSKDKKFTENEKSNFANKSISHFDHNIHFEEENHQIKYTDSEDKNNSNKLDDKNINKMEQPNTNLRKQRKRGNVNPSQKTGIKKFEFKRMYSKMPERKPTLMQEFYLVDLKQIKFMIYDFSSDKLVEISDDFRFSQIEFKKNETFSGDKKQVQSKNQMKKKRKTQIIDDQEKEDQINNEFILMKQLEYALSKQETSPEITKLRLISTVNILLILSVIIVMFVFMMIGQINLLDNIQLISNSFNLIMNNIKGVFFTRELVLLNNNEYSNFIPTKEIYMKNVTDNLLNIFSNSSNLYNDILIKEIAMKKDIEFNTNFSGFNLAYEDYIQISILQTLNFIRELNTSLDSAFKEANTALYHLANTHISQISNINQDVFFYIFNIMNSINFKFSERSFFYVDYIQNEINNNIMKFLYVLISSGIVSIFILISIYNSFLAIIRRKQSYLEVFFEIGEDVIKKSIDNCERFSSKLKIEKNNENNDLSESDSLNKSEEEEEEQDNKMQEYAHLNNLGGLQNANKNLNNNNNNNSSSGGENSQKKKGSKSAETMQFTFKLCIILIIFFSYFIFVNFLCSSYLERFSGFITFYNTTNFMQTSNLNNINILREYLSDSNSLIKNESLGKTLDEKINNFYEFELENNKILKKYLKTLPSDFYLNYLRISNNALCPQIKNSLNNYLSQVNLTCETFMYNSTTNGLNVLSTNFIEEIRQIKFNFDIKRIKQKENFEVLKVFVEKYFEETIQIGSISSQKEKEKNEILNFLEDFVYNNYTNLDKGNTKYLIEEKLKRICAEVLSDKNFEELNSFSDNEIYLSIKSGNFSIDALSGFGIFNEAALNDINIIDNFVIKPAYSFINKSLITNMQTIIEFYSLIFTGSFGLFMFIVICFYIFDWKPFVNELDSTIYKTKNMLSIIPKEVLISLSNIEKLLNLGNNINKKGNKGNKNLKNKQPPKILNYD